MAETRSRRETTPQRRPIRRPPMPQADVEDDFREREAPPRPERNDRDQIDRDAGDQRPEQNERPEREERPPQRDGDGIQAAPGTTFAAPPNAPPNEDVEEAGF